MSKSDAGKGDDNNRISNWKKYYEADYWKELEKRKELEKCSTESKSISANEND